MYTAKRLLALRTCDFVHNLSEEKIMEFFYSCNAVWLHNGDPVMPHVELTTGLCSNGYFNCGNIAVYPNIWEILAVQLYKKLKPVSEVDWVIGSSYSAITLSYDIAKLFGVKSGFPEKDPSDPKGKKMIWQGSKIRPGEKILQVEELITTFNTTLEVRRAVKIVNPYVEFLPVVGCIVYRPPKFPVVTYNGLKVISLVEKEIWAVKPEECPLCKAGSKRLRAKENWQELTAKVCI